MIWLLIPIAGAIGFAYYIDRRRKKNNNNPETTTHPHAKPGDDSNYVQGDNRYMGPGGS
ncbi:hypothetical protein [Falsibacillus albus]|uniref:hypothetical protein n=1 Tax=Falsibacillus albus TaxID=2478915 RepID=UPI0018F3D693|nr:hypothetical protein [Falsibacillus albus]